MCVDNCVQRSSEGGMWGGVRGGRWEEGKWEEGGGERREEEDLATTGRVAEEVARYEKHGYETSFK